MKLIILKQISLPSVEFPERCYDLIPAVSWPMSPESDGQIETHPVRCLSLAKWQDDQKVTVKLLLRYNAGE